MFKLRGGILSEEFMLINELKQLKKKEGLTETSIRKLARKKKIPVVKLYEVATFYAFLGIGKPAKHTILVCNSPSCYINGSTNIIKIFEKKLKKNKKVELKITQCIGCCDQAPAALINGKVYGNLDEEKISQIIKKLK